MFSRVNAFGFSGAEGYPVTVECSISNGLPAFDIVGLPDTAVKESRDRVRAAAKNLDIEFPKGRITVNLAPADTKKEGALYDLPILLSILRADGKSPSRLPIRRTSASFRCRESSAPYAVPCLPQSPRKNTE